MGFETQYSEIDGARACVPLCNLFNIVAVQ